MSLLGSRAPPSRCVARLPHVVAAGGIGDVPRRLCCLRERASAAGRQTQTPVISNDVPNGGREPSGAAPGAYRNIAVVPLSTRAASARCRCPTGAEFDHHDADTQRLADHVAVAIVNARPRGAGRSRAEGTVAFNAIPTGTAVIDDDGRIVGYNSCAAAGPLRNLSGPGAPVLRGRVRRTRARSVMAACRRRRFTIVLGRHHAVETRGLLSMSWRRRT
jgi:hypothetical protein